MELKEEPPLEKNDNSYSGSGGGVRRRQRWGDVGGIYGVIEVEAVGGGGGRRWREKDETEILERTMCSDSWGK